MQRFLELLETRDGVHVLELAEEFAVSGGDSEARPLRARRQGLVARVRGGVRALQRGQSELGFDLRLHLESPREAGDRPRRRGDGRRWRVGRARLEHDGVLPRARAASEARARRRHERAADRGRARGLARASPSSSPAACSASPRCRSSATSAPTSCAGPASTKASSERAGSALERGLMDLNPDEVRIKQEMADACEQVIGDLRQDEVAPERAALVRAGRTCARDRHRQRARRRRGRGMARARRRGDHGGTRGRRAAPGRLPGRGHRPTARARAGVARCGAADGDHGRRRSGRPERARRRRPLRRRAARRSTRCTGSRTSPSERAARCTGTCSGSTSDVLDGLRRAAHGRPQSIRSGSTPGASTSACSIATAGSSRTRCTTATAARARVRRAARAKCRRASSTSAPGSS